MLKIGILEISSEMPCKCFNMVLKRIDKTSWKDRMKNQEIFYSHGREEHPMCNEKRKSVCFGHIVRKNCLL